MSDQTYTPETLRATKQQDHDVCDDCWYSCPKSEDYCGDASKDECRCGMDEENASIDAHSNAWQARERRLGACIEMLKAEGVYSEEAIEATAVILEDRASEPPSTASLGDRVHDE